MGGDGWEVMILQLIFSVAVDIVCVWCKPIQNRDSFVVNTLKQQILM